MARELRPHVITLDLLMADLDGWQVLAALKGDPALASIPVIVASVTDEKNSAFALGASEYLTKPIQREALEHAIARNCSLYDRPARVLLVEDDAVTREMTEVMLRKVGCSVVSAENGRRALAALAAGEEAPDALIVDLMMPEMDGFEFIERVREDQRFRKIPVLVLTAKEISSEERARLTAGAARIFHKGQFNRRDLLEEIRKHL